VSGGAHPASDDPRRWVTLAIATVTVVIVSLDSTVLNVAIPTILKDFHTTLPSLQWVITGYALTFASMLIIGGRLGDMYGHRRIFIIGAGLFGLGSLIAALSQSVPQMVLGEAVIEGIGASLMMPSSLAILSNTFTGRDRATAFGLWGAVGGASGALGPVVGGFLTTNYSWRWSFGINVVIVPVAIAGAMIYMPESKGDGERKSLDFPGALLVAVGMAMLVFCLSEGATYGWFHPIRAAVIGSRQLWPATRSLSFVPVVFAVSIVLLAVFYRFERWKEQRDAEPLFEFGQLSHRGFRFGLLTVVVLSVGQLALQFVLPVLLQEGQHLSAARNGLWILPVGLFFLVGAQAGSRLARRLPLVRIVRVGLGVAAIGFLTVAASISAHLSFLKLLPGEIVYAVGFGLASTQLTNIVLADIDRDKSGSASGANVTARQMGNAIGIALVGSILTSVTLSQAGKRISGSNGLAPSVKVAARAALRGRGVTFEAPPRSTVHDVDVLHRAFVDGLVVGTRTVLIFAGVVTFLALGVSLLLPAARHQRPVRYAGEEQPDMSHLLE
jgi:EmrB/QacA subfamily drug resistance transporter